MSELTTLGTATVPIEAMSNLIGELNTEAHCIALTATPTELTPISDITDSLRQYNAYETVDIRRFNVHGLLSSMDDNLAQVVKDPLPERQRAAWARKEDGAVGEFATGMAGALLGYSVDRSLPLRAILGEKRRGKDGDLHSVQTRLGILAMIAAHDQEGEPFTSTDITKAAEQYGIHPRTGLSHFSRLTKQGYLVSSARKPKSYEVLERPDGSTFTDDILALFKVVGEFTVGSISAIDQGTARGRELLRDTKVLPRLVERSYTSSTHTGKNTPHNTKNHK